MKRIKYWLALLCYLIAVIKLMGPFDFYHVPKDFHEAGYRIGVALPGTIDMTEAVAMAKKLEVAGKQIAKTMKLTFKGIGPRRDVGGVIVAFMGFKI